jgi:hypothetical protein
MEFKIHQHHKTQIAELVTEGTEINNVKDALDLIDNADYHGARKIIIKESHLTPSFFDL